MGFRIAAGRHRAWTSLGIAASFVVLLCAQVSAAPVNYTARLIDPEDDVHVSASSGMGNANEGALVEGHESVDIVRVTSLADDGILTLTMDLVGNTDKSNFYAFAIQVTSSGRLWNDRDAVAILTNGTAALYLSSGGVPHDIPQARMLDATTGASLETKTARIALNVAVLGSVEHYQVHGYAFKDRIENGNKSGYFFDSSLNAQMMSGDFWAGFLASWGTLVLLMVFIFIFFMVFRYKESLNRKAASRPCKYCKKPVSRGLIFCPACGKGVDDKNE
ncbi:MAG TPA: hypothetical protein VI893_00420 [Thermoplasmata archaeon]|nr:hypothetical protein [Thermoplasmata archaeon]